ncbi:phage minor head protein [Thermogutta sp.]|uniref:phage minor head protein n=1 Tax=Thermogutta sp. TaxID=1962930 RepID=UPI00321FB4A7
MRWLPYLLRVVKQDEAEEEWEREFSQGMAEFLAQAQIEMRRMRVPERYLEAGIRATMHTVPGIGETAKKEARRILREVVESTPPDQFTFARRLRERWRHLSKRKSEEIAITEWRRMSATAHYLEAKDAGWEGKIWLTVGDERVCPTCRMLMAVGPQRLTEPWPIGEQHPPAHSRCRCTLSYIWRL